MLPDTFEKWFAGEIFERRSYVNEIQKYVPDYDPRTARFRILKLLKQEVIQQFPLKKETPNTQGMKIIARMEQYIRENPPVLKPLSLKVDSRKLDSFLEHQMHAQQFMPLPKTWVMHWGLKANAKVVTDYGVVVTDIDGQANLIFHASRSMDEIAAPKKAEGNSRQLRIATYRSQFDPPRRSELEMLKQSIRNGSRFYLLDSLLRSTPECYAAGCKTPDG